MRTLLLLLMVALLLLGCRSATTSPDKVTVVDHSYGGMVYRVIDTLPETGTIVTCYVNGYEGGISCLNDPLREPAQ